MIDVRPSEDRGTADYGWLKPRYSFSFGHYYDPAHLGFGHLIVMNEDRIAPGGGFDTHGHRDMEIITYILDGGLAHKDSLGSGSVIRPGEVQLMRAGRGIRHSEYNHSKTDPVHLLQIWIVPSEKGLEPGYQQKSFREDIEAGDGLRLVVSPDGADGSLQIAQDARLYAGRIAGGASWTHPVADGRQYWLQVARGNVSLNGHDLGQGDGAAIRDGKAIEITADTEGEVLLFDLHHMDGAAR